MGFLDSFFQIKTDKPQIDEQKSETVPQNISVSKTQNTFSNLIDNTSNSAGSFDQKISDKLFSALEKANLTGNDFFEFCRALEVSTSLNESEKFKSTYNILKNIDSSVTKQSLLKTAQHYKEVINQQELEAKGFVEDKTALFSKQIEEHNEIILKNQKEIQEKQLQISEAQAELTKIQTFAKNFDVTFKEIKAKIIDNIINGIEKNLE